ncbi:MAG: hypothetical protein WD431_04745, partial [Cyclobacteriaceae bacterium]
FSLFRVPDISEKQLLPFSSVYILIFIGFYLPRTEGRGACLLPPASKGGETKSKGKPEKKTDNTKKAKGDLPFAFIH